MAQKTMEHVTWALSYLQPQMESPHRAKAACRRSTNVARPRLLGRTG